LVARKRQARCEFYAKLRACNIGSQRSIFEDALPKVFQAGLFTSKIWHEIARHHKWLSLVFYYSEVYPRFLRVLALITHIVTAIFFIALTYAEGNPEQGQECASYQSREDCTAPRSRYYTGQARCSWSNRDASCQFRQPHVLIRVILFVVIFAVILASPVNMVTDYIFKHLLAAPTHAAAPALNASAKYLPSTDNLEEQAGDDTADGNHDNDDHNDAVGDNTNPNIGTGDGLRGKPALTAVTSADAEPGAVNSDRTVVAKSQKHRAAEALAELEREIRRYREAHVKGIVERRRFDSKCNSSLVHVDRYY
jgi:hypothetical protein